MADEPADEALREAARNRGLKLVKSRRRKPGGDYGRFGLRGADGKPLFGIADDGLTASSADIAAYLRRGEQSTWAESARVTPKAPEATKAEPAADEPAAKPAQAASGDDGQGKDKGEGKKPERRREAKRAERQKPPPQPPAAPEPKLAIRPARAQDAEAIATLAGGGDVKQAKRLIVESTRAGEEVLVAEHGGIVGVLAWQSLRTLGGPLGRITLLIVAPDSRRAGIGRALLDAAIAAMTRRGCTEIEALSDIDIRNANGFFRAADFQQASYRFLRRLR